MTGYNLYLNGTPTSFGHFDSAEAVEYFLRGTAYEHLPARYTLPDGSLMWGQYIAFRDQPIEDMNMPDFPLPVDYVARVLALKEEHRNTWRDKPDSYWFMALVQEVGELGQSLMGEHEHIPEHELEQIAAICLNWLEKRNP